MIALEDMTDEQAAIDGQAVGFLFFQILPMLEYVHGSADEAVERVNTIVEGYLTERREGRGTPFTPPN